MRANTAEPAGDQKKPEPPAAAAVAAPPPAAMRRSPVAPGKRAQHPLVTALAECRRGLVVVALFSLALNLLMLTAPLYMITVYDRVLSSRSAETLLMITIVAVGALVLVGVLEAVRQVILNRVGARLETRLGGPALDSAIASARTTGGDIQGLRDLAQVRQFLSSPLVGVFFDAPVAPLYIALVFFIHPVLGWLTVVAAVLLLLVSLVNQKMTSRSLSQSAQASMAAQQRAQVHARNAEVVRALGMLPNCITSWGEANAAALTAGDRAGRIQAAFTGFTRFLRLLLQIGILGTGAYLVLTHNELSGGIIIAASIISARALAPVDQAVGGWRTLVGSWQAWRRLRSQLEEMPVERERVALPAPVASLSVERLLYATARGAEPIIKGLQFQIEAGEAIGIIGPSGAGKSTLARLLVGALQPTGGVVRIGGDDLRHWRAEDLGPHLGYVPQDVELFPATVAANISRLAPEPDDAAVVAAAKLANCHELIQRLPLGYDTPIGPTGVMLSGGQRQRVALARAFYGKPRVLVLDEPNASLDPEGEQAFLAALAAAKQEGMTVVVVTQRMNIAPALDKVMVMREGRIEDFGPRDEVLQRQMRAQQPGATAAPAQQGPLVLANRPFIGGQANQR